MPTVLIVDDDAHIRDVVGYALAREGFTVEQVTDGAEALERMQRGGIDLIVLDVLMPDLDGLSVCRRVRASSNVPIVMLSSRGESVDRILGIELGADDYLAKPFSPRELVIRVQAVLRRFAPPPVAAPLRHGRLVVDPERHDVRVGDERIDLTATEFAVLATLLRRPGRLFTRAQLISHTYDGNHHITERTIDTHVKRIRAKLRGAGVDPIETVHGLGYKVPEP